MDNIHIKRVLDKIALDLLNGDQHIHENNQGIYRGEMGVAIFFALYYISGKKKEKAYLNKIYEIVEKSLNQISSQESNSLLGVAGVGWGIQYLVNIDILTSDEVTEYLDKLYYFVRSSLTEDKKVNNYDLLDGYIGKALFLIQARKQQHPASLQEVLTDCLTFFDSFAINEGEGVSWDCSDFTEKNTFYLGLSHGVASIIYFLSDLYLLIDNVNERNQARHFISSACAWLLKKERNTGDKELSYPAVYPDKNQNSMIRLAWCHGDLGISLALIKAGKVLDNVFFINEGVRIAKRGSELSYLASGIRHKQGKFDCSLCHGIYGAFFIYHKLYEELKIPAFKTAANYWLSIIMKYNSNSFDAPFCGITNINRDFSEKEILIEKRERGLLFGVTGSALALLTYLADTSDQPLNQVIKQNPWYKILMLNL